MKKIMKKLNKKGFTLAELLIVVAIIAVLVAISIPIFSSQMEKARDAVSIANIRAAYAEAMTVALTEDTNASSSSTAYTITPTTNTDGTMKVVAVVTLKQTKDGWQNTAIKEIGGVDVSAMTPTAGGNCTVTYDGSATDPLTIAF